MNLLASKIPGKGTAIKILLSIGILGAILYFVDFNEAINILLSANPWYIAAFVVLIYIDRALMAYKWNPLLVAMKVHVPFFALYRLYSAAPLAGIMLPSTIGGDVFRIYSLSRYKIKAGAVISSIIVEKVIGFIAIMVPAGLAILLASILLKDKWEQFQGIVWVFLGLIVFGLIAVWVMQGSVKKLIDTLATRFSHVPLVGKIHYIYSTFSEYRNHWDVIGFVFMLTVLEQMVPIFGTFLLVRALHIDATFAELAMVVPIVVLAIRMPISFDGIGVQEGVNVILFGLIGISVEEALILTIVNRILHIFCALPWVLYFVLGRNKARSDRAPAIANFTPAEGN